MTRKPTHLTHINAIINRHDVLHPFEKTFVSVHWVRLDLACHSFSTKVKGFLLQNFHILGNQGILFTAYPAADTQFFKTSGVVLANVCEVYACATTLLSFLWCNISTPRATVFPISRCVVWGWLYAVEPISNRSSVKWGFSCSKEPFKPKGLNINFSCACHYLHAHAPHFMSMTIVRRRNNNGFLDTEEELFKRNVCFLKTFDTFWLFNGILSYPQPVNQLDEMY